MASFWKSKLEQLSSNLHFIIIAFILLAIALMHPLMFIFYFIYLIYIFKRKDIVSLIKTIIIIISLTLSFCYYKPFIVSFSESFSGIVLEKKEHKVVASSGLKKYILYTEENIIPGDYIEGKIEEKPLAKPSYAGDFDEALYLKSNGYKGSYRLKSCKVIGSYRTLGYFKYKLLDYYKSNMSPEYFQLFSALIFGVNEISDETSKSLSRLNLMHILALSGFHLNLIYLVANKLLFRLTRKKYLAQKIALLFSFFYALFCGLSISLLRAFLFMYLSYLNERHQEILTKLDLFSLTFLLCAINPLRIYSLGFILSFLSSFTFLFINDFIHTNHKLLRSFLTGVIILLLNFPFITSINNELSLLSLFSFLLLDFFTYFFIPLCFSFLAIPGLSFHLDFITKGFASFIGYLGNTLKITFPYMSFPIRVIYYFSLILILASLSRGKIKKLGLALFCLVLIFFKLQFRLASNYLEFIDVGQGDTCYLNSNGKGFLIDCYNTLDFLEKRDIRSLEAIFITHSDRDHMGDLDNVLKSIEVKIVYINAYDNGIDSICKSNNVKLKKLKYYNKLRIGDALITVLGPTKEFAEKNSNSLILDIRMLNHSFLFMGDATTESEYELIENNLIGHYDLLKVGHHGSITSTSAEFLDIVRPSLAVISLGTNNYGMPNQIVLERLKQYAKIYITMDSGNIKFINRGIKTYRNICYN